MALINCKECNHKISDKAKFCPSCGAPINDSTVDNYKLIDSIYDFLSFNSFAFDIFIAATIIGIINKSWLGFFIVLIGLFVTLMIPIVNNIIIFAFAFIYAYAGYKIGSFLFSKESGYAIAIILFLGRLSIGRSAIKYFDYINNKN